ncbi:MAG: hypothetical protein M3Q78_12445 [Acidobacteriota bacterium]|jgi:hypothetical protein|nr:hypothetical protein [Acidobacteriota bacterium]
MSKFLTLLIGAILGLIIGGILTFYFFVGAPRAVQPPGNPILPPDANGSPAGTATVVLNQQFFDAILGTIFRDMNAPAFPLNLSGQNNQTDFQPTKIALMQGGNCEGKITLLPEGSGVQTGIRLENGKISAPLAFKGSYNLGGCIEFSGWAQAGLNLRYDDAEKNVFGQINVETVNLDGVTPLISGVIAQFVQNSLNQRVNPITILRGQQIALSVPISATEGTLNAQVKEVRAEVKENALNLYVSYDFKGTK